MSILASVASPLPSQGAITTAAYMRVVSLAIAVYDYLLTLPSEYRMYKTSERRSPGLILFVLIRYISIIVIVASNVGFFYHGFTPKSCRHFFFILPVLKVVQMMISHAILGIRTYNISQRDIRVGRTIVVAYFFAVTFEWVAAATGRIPQMTDVCVTIFSLQWRVLK
ncbi:hypothetical protein BGW80DRAFT_879285 [Lactifluus volemus]|nr:hypothetical protein BGW80DRAFT_879285 [Lactifluus volemus]